MGFTKTGGKSTFKAWKEWKEGDFISGIFMNTKPNHFNPQNLDVIIQIEDSEFQDGQKLKVGENFTLNHLAIISKQIERGDWKQGDRVHLEYMGKEALGDNHKFKGTMAHSINMAVDLEYRKNGNSVKSDALENATVGNESAELQL